MWHDNEDDDRQHNRRNEVRSTPSTVHTLLFWVVVVCFIILTLYLFHSKEDEDRLIQSDFERALVERRVKSATLRHDPGTGVTKVTGDYSSAPNSAEVRPYQADVYLDDTLGNKIRQNVPAREAKPVSNMLGQVIFNLVLPILVILFIIYFLFARQLRNAGRGAMQFGKSRARLVQSVEKITFADVAGIREAKEEVQEIVEYLKDPDRFHRLGGRIPKGVLMVGRPGTGKTLLARAIAGEAGVPFFSISGSDFVEMFVGVGASRVRDMFEQGKKNAPCIIFIDEIDAVGRSRFSGIGGGHDEREQTLNALLVELDGFEGKSGVIVIAATNRPDVLDPALLRPGRFDRQIVIDLPDMKGRLEILQVHAKKIKLSDTVDLALIARGTPGFSGADLENVINEAALLAARNGKNAVGTEDFEEARDKVCWGKERRSRVMSEHDRRVTAFHEAGHALIGLHCTHCTPLHKVTIIPRGSAYLGAAMYLPHQDKYTTTRDELVDEMTMTMGGRCAEELVFSESSNGAAADIKSVTDVARRMVCEWGMSPRIGLINYARHEDLISFGRDITATRGNTYSEATAREIDLEIRELVDSCFQRAKGLLAEHREQLEKLGAALLERETMDVAEIRELLGLSEPAADATPQPTAPPA